MVQIMCDTCSENKGVKERDILPCGRKNCSEMTYGDIIRQMSDEQLAEWLTSTKTFGSFGETALNELRQQLVEFFKSKTKDEDDYSVFGNRAF